MRAATLCISGPIDSIYICSMTPLPTILALWNFWIHIHTMNSNNIATNVEASVNKALGLCTTLGIPNINPNN